MLTPPSGFPRAKLRSLVDEPMWCKQCRQDVPGIASRGESCAHCSRCGSELRYPSIESAAPIATGVDAITECGLDLSDPATESQASNKRSTPPPSPIVSDDWALEADLQRIKRMAAANKQAAQTPTPIMASASQMPSMMLPPAPSVHRSPTRSFDASQLPVQVKHQSSWLAWLFMASGLMGLVCGGVLLGWSKWEARPELWEMGLPVALGGQLGLMLGLVVQLDHLWRVNRQTATKLDEVGYRLHDLNQTAAMLGTTHTAPAQAFYSHLAEGANPHLLLADLKGQLDLLAMRMAERR